MLKKKGLLQRSLDRIEFIGNKLPHPVTLFALLALLVLVLSAVFSQFGISVEHPGEEGKIVEEGTHTELTKLKDKYYELVKNQLELGN